MDPRTFLRPRALPVAAAPDVGQTARGLPVGLEDGRPAIVAFLRHTGCPFAESTLRGMRRHAADAPQIQWLAVSHAPPGATASWCQAIGGCDGVRVTSDPSRRTYADWGLGRTSLGHFLGRRSLSGVARLARTGIRNRHPHGTRWQMAGTFALDDRGQVRWRHLPSHAGDLPDLKQAMSSIA